MNDIYNLNNFFVRTPLYPFENYNRIPKHIDDLDEFIATLWRDLVFKEALLLASPDLYFEWEKAMNNSAYSENKRKGINFSLLKYYIRSTSRSTPFGLFSSYSEILNSKNSDSPTQNIKKRFTSLDLAFLYRVVDHLNKNYLIRTVLKFTKNSSLYKVGDHYRYIEVFFDGDNRKHTLTSLQSDSVLKLVFDKLEESTSMEELADYIINYLENISKEEVLAYIHSLIDAQIIVSNLDICLNEEQALNQLLFVFVENKEVLEDVDCAAIYLALTNIQKRLLELDETFGNQLDKYQEIYQEADKIGFPYSRKNLINVNFRNDSDFYSLNDEELSHIKSAIGLLRQFSASTINKNSPLEKFKNAFYRRYEDAEMPLNLVLDNEIGIGYIQENAEKSDFSSLIDDIKWDKPNTSYVDFAYDLEIHTFWGKLLFEAVKNRQRVIDLATVELPNFHGKEARVARTFSVLVSKVNNQIFLDTVSGNSSLNLITKFANADQSLKKNIDKIVVLEQDSEDCINAELLHVPEHREGNILLRKIDRQYEIAFLTKSSNRKKMISIDDLFLKMVGDTLILKSKSLNKRVKIFNTSAHNFQNNSLPIYQFLCELQYQNIDVLDLNLGSAAITNFLFIPRIVYGNKVIMAAARWQLYYADFEKFLNINTTDITEALKSYLRSIEVVRFVYIMDGDNKLLIDTENSLLLTFILDRLKKDHKMVLVECLYDLSTDFKDNEIIIPFVNNRKLDALAVGNTFPSNMIKSTFIPGDDWLYYKIYTGVKTADKILIEVLSPLWVELTKARLIKKWFFIRYTDTDFHLRVRFELNEQLENSVEKTMFTVNRFIKNWIHDQLIWKLEMATYERELERYEQQWIAMSELIFCFDSIMTVQLIEAVRADSDDVLWLLVLKCIDSYFNLFSFELDQKQKIIADLYDSYQIEFSATKLVRHQINSKFRKHQKQISELLSIADFEKYGDYLHIIDQSMREISNQCQGIKDLTRLQAQNLIRSYIHMHINRMIRSNPRIHELVLYGLLEKYYQKQLAQKRDL